VNTSKTSIDYLIFYQRLAKVDILKLKAFQKIRLLVKATESMKNRLSTSLSFDVIKVSFGQTKVGSVDYLLFDASMDHNFPTLGRKNDIVFQLYQPDNTRSKTRTSSASHRTLAIRQEDLFNKSNAMIWTERDAKSLHFFDRIKKMKGDKMMKQRDSVIELLLDEVDGDLFSTADIVSAYYRHNADLKAKALSNAKRQKIEKENSATANTQTMKSMFISETNAIDKFVKEFDSECKRLLQDSATTFQHYNDPVIPTPTLKRWIAEWQQVVPITSAIKIFQLTSKK
jgi:hypothetical protein